MDKSILEKTLAVQLEVISNQKELINQLILERDEARRNLATASEQWRQWRKELVSD